METAGAGDGIQLDRWKGTLLSSAGAYDGEGQLSASDLADPTG